MKKKLVLLFSLLIYGIVFTQEMLVSDITLYKDISQSFENEYYPRTIEKVELLQKLYPDSVFMQSALVYKAKSLIFLSDYEQAIITLKNAISHMHTGKEDFTLCYYLLGKSYFHQRNYKDALNSFFIACKVSTIENKIDYYNSSVLYAAECCYQLEEYNQAAILFEYIIEHGNYYAKSDYESSIVKLFISYDKTESYKKIISLFNSLDLSSNFFNIDLQNLLKFYAAKAYEKESLYDNSYNVYLDLMELNTGAVVESSLKNIFNMYVSHKIDINMGDLIYKISPKIENNKELLNDLWLRLGIDEYNNNNDEKASEYFKNVSRESNIVNIYTAKMILDKDSSMAGGKKAEDILLKCKELEEENNIINISDSYYSLLLQCKIQQDIWDDVPVLFGKIKQPGHKENYIISTYYYKNGEFEKVRKDTGILYASTLCRLSNFQEACVIFEELDKQNQISKENLIEYSKALFMIERYEDAYSIALRSNDLQKEYICGLCKINIGDYKTALDYFMSYIRHFSNNKQFNELVFYYKGYIEYSFKEYRNAYSSFLRFISDADDKLLRYIGYSHKYAAISAVENGNIDSAVFHGRSIINIAENEEAKIDATRFCFEILYDCEKYEDALELLLPYTSETPANKNSSFMEEALFKVATTYEKLGNYKFADEAYKKVYTDYSYSEYAEEALYRSCEIYYFMGDYFSSYNRFNDYVYKYTNGKFTDSALYFSGDCALKLGEINKSIMINRNMIFKYPESKYGYSACKNLLVAYYEQEAYEYALEVARELLEKYPEQSNLDKIYIKVAELEKIVSGADRYVVEKYSEYESKGGSETQEGRIIGSELVKLYAADASMKKNAYDLALELLEKQEKEFKENKDKEDKKNEEDKDNDELQYAAENSEFIGDYFRAEKNNKEAANYYLKAAKYYRSIDNSIKAATVLYSATEAFVAAGLIGDARATADLLKELYPYSKYAERVYKIVR